MMPRYAVAVLLALAALAAGLWMGLRTDRQSPPQELAATVLPAPKPLPPFSLVDQDHRPFGLERLKGKWSFLFFGYTHCPDVCPMTLATMRTAHEHLAATPSVLENAQFVFVSVDPERDTPEQLKSYVSYFNKDFLGVTGDEAQLQDLTHQLGILYVRAGGSEGDYAVDHTTAILLIDPEARLSAIFSAPHDAEKIASAFLKIRDLKG
jgi:protein SCO1/2